MPISSNLSLLESFDGTPIFTNYSGGSGAGVNDDIVIQGTSSGGRRVDNAIGKGFGVTLSPTANLSAANTHIKVWLFITQWAAVSQVSVRISSGSDDDHILSTNDFPALGGFIPVWVDVSRTPETGGSANEASINEIGSLIDIGNVGGNADNLILDAIHSGTSGLTWTGSGGDFSQFNSYELTNREGNIVEQNGILFCYSRLEIGDTAGPVSSFSDSNKKLIFPDQSLVSNTFMGISLALNVGDSISLTNISIESSDPQSATNRPDFVCSGNSTTEIGVFNSVGLIGMRTVELTEAVSMNNCTIDALSLVQSNAKIQNSTLQPRSVSGVAFCSDPVFSTEGISNASVIQAGSGHAFEITTPGNYTLTSINFSGFGGTEGSNLVANSGSLDAAVYNNSGGIVNITIDGGSGVSVRNGAGSTTNILNNISLTITGLTVGQEVRIFENIGTEQNPISGNEIAGIENVADVFFTFSVPANEPINIVVIDESVLPAFISTNAPAASSSIPLQLLTNRVFLNPQ